MHLLLPTLHWELLDHRDKMQNTLEMTKEDTLLSSLGGTLT